MFGKDSPLCTPIPGTFIRQTFTSTSLASLLSFELQATGLHFACTSVEHPQAKSPEGQFTAQVPAPTPLEKTTQQLHQ